MKFNLLRHKVGCRRLLLIFSGWSTTPDFYSHIVKDGWDTGVVTDYSDLSLNKCFLDSYDTIWVFAWSLGVKMAAMALPPDKIVAAYAINGTLNPVDDSEGIPLNIYIGTADNLNSRNLVKFQLRMAGSKDIYNKYFGKEYSDDEIFSLRNELDLIRNIDSGNNNLPWRRAFLGSNDKIFPFENMCRSWKSMNVDITELDEPHYVDLMQIVNMVVPDIDNIARRFTESNDSYLENARAQRKISQKLACLLQNYTTRQGGNALEIGPGKGLFTREYACSLKPDCIDFVDITKLDKFAVAKVERYFQEDAESFIGIAKDKSYDSVLSSSAVQWFSNFHKFIENSARILTNDGVLCFSTFAKGNLAELDGFRTSPLHYLSTEEISEIVSQYFKDVEVTKDIIKLEFENPRDLMMHLKLTGVGGFAPSSGLSPMKLRNTKTLTFCPVYVLARKK